MATAPSPAGDLIWLRDGQQPGHLLFFDWAGRQVGSLTVSGRVMPSPDGRRALLDSSSFVDYRGASLGPLSIGSSIVDDAAWAEDSKHLCVIARPRLASQEGGVSSLWLASVGHPAKKIAAVGRLGSLPGVTACSLANDRAVIVSDFSTHWPPPQGGKVLSSSLVQVIRLSTGRVMYQHDYILGATSPPALVLASLDGRYLIQNLGGRATIVDSATGASLNQVSEGDVEGFSADDTRLVVSNPLASGHALQMLAWPGLNTLWQQSPDYGGFWPRRQAPDIVYQVISNSGAEDVYILRATGTARLLKRDASLAYWCACLGAGAGAA